MEDERISSGGGPFSFTPVPRYGYRSMESARRYASNIFMQNPDAKNGVVTKEMIEDVGDSHAAILAYTLYALYPDMDKESLILMIENILTEMLSKTLAHYQGIRMWQEYAKKFGEMGLSANPRP